MVNMYVIGLLIRLSWVRPPHVPPPDIVKPLCIYLQSGFFIGARLLIVPVQDRDADAAVARIERVVRVVGGGVGHPFNAGKTVAFHAAFFD